MLYNRRSTIRLPYQSLWEVLNRPGFDKLFDLDPHLLQRLVVFIPPPEAAYLIVLLAATSWKTPWAVSAAGAANAG